MSPQVERQNMKYSRAIRLSVLAKILPPNNQSIRSVSREHGISEQTIRNWKAESISGKLSDDNAEKSPAYYSSSEKYGLLMESAKLSDDALGTFLRERGLHSEHLTLWNQELREMVKNKSIQRDTGVKADKKRIRELEKELARKEKALAEAAALLILKKKLEALWEGREDD